MLDALAAAGWRVAGARTPLPARRAVRQYVLEIQDFRELVYDEGALRLYTSRSGEVVFALLVDLKSRHRDVVPPRGDGRYRVFARAGYALVIPRRPVGPDDFEVAPGVLRGGCDSSGATRGPAPICPIRLKTPSRWIRMMAGRPRCHP